MLTDGRRAVALVDGEHYPPVIRAALEDLRLRGTDVVAALVLGGTEKVAEPGVALDIGVPTRWTDTAGHLDADGTADALVELLDLHRPDVVVDLSDEPVLDARQRLRLAARVLLAGVPYEGSDFGLYPPPRPRLARRPTIAVIGTGKRTGKTAVAGELARRLVDLGHVPVVVAMGRGGPPEPLVIEAHSALDVYALLSVAAAGGHAASDFYEDALTSGVATVGARRCGGGLAGAVAHSNVAAAIAAADDQPGDVTVVEGSGAAIPPVHADATLLVVPGDADPELLVGYLGSYRLLLADVVALTMAEPPRSSPHQVEDLIEAIRSTSRATPILRIVFRPVPLGRVSGAKVFFATTAPPAVSTKLAAILEREHDCEVLATSSNLSDRAALRRELEAAPAFDVLLVELKAAAIDVAARMAVERDARVVFCDNRPAVVAVDTPAPDRISRDPETAMADAARALAELARDRFAESARLSG